MRQDLISRCELFNRLATVQTLGEAYAVIQDMPTVERKTGKWVKAQFVLTSNPPKYVWNCSECGKSVNGYSAVVLTDYCPNCGSYNGG